MTNLPWAQEGGPGLVPPVHVGAFQPLKLAAADAPLLGPTARRVRHIPAVTPCCGAGERAVDAAGKSSFHLSPGPRCGWASRDVSDPPGWARPGTGKVVERGNGLTTVTIHREQGLPGGSGCPPGRFVQNLEFVRRGV